MLNGQAFFIIKCSTLYTEYDRLHQPNNENNNLIFELHERKKTNNTAKLI